MTKVEARRYVKLREVYIEHPFPRCCATGCGDKIKPISSGDTCLEVTWLGGDVTYLEFGCIEWFVHGHPDYGYGYGKILEIVGENQITLLPSVLDDREILFHLGVTAEDLL